MPKGKANTDQAATAYGYAFHDHTPASYEASLLNDYPTIQNRAC